MVTGGALGASAAAGAEGSRGTLSETTLVARLLGAGRSPCCAARAVAFRSERTTTKGAQRIGPLAWGSRSGDRIRPAVVRTELQPHHRSCTAPRLDPDTSMRISCRTRPSQDRRLGSL